MTRVTLSVWMSGKLKNLRMNWRRLGALDARGLKERNLKLTWFAVSSSCRSKSSLRDYRSTFLCFCTPILWIMSLKPSLTRVAISSYGNSIIRSVFTRKGCGFVGPFATDAYLAGSSSLPPAVLLMCLIMLMKMFPMVSIC